MKRITSITELNKGDKIVRVHHNGEYEIIEFLCIHPYNEEYSLFLNQNKDGMPKFYNGRLKGEEWYLYNRNNNFNEVIDMRIELLNRHIEKLKTLKKTPLTQPKQVKESDANVILNSEFVKGYYGNK